MKGASKRAKAMVRTKDGKFEELPESAKPKHPVTTRNQGENWSEEEIQQLNDLAKGNTPTRVLSIKLGRSVASIRDKAAEEKISLKPSNRSPYGTVDKKGSKKKVAKKTATKRKTSSKKVKKKTSKKS